MYFMHALRECLPSVRKKDQCRDDDSSQHHAEKSLFRQERMRTVSLRQYEGVKFSVSMGKILL